MPKALSQAIMRRSRVKNISIKNQNEENWIDYKKQQNFCTNILKKPKQFFFCNLNMKDLNDSKRFWKK